jgi:hypothetical protein
MTSPQARPTIRSSAGTLPPPSQTLVYLLGVSTGLASVALAGLWPTIAALAVVAVGILVFGYPEGPPE